MCSIAFSEQRLPAVAGAQPVVFKLLQAVRLAVEGGSAAEAAVAVGGDAAFLARAVEWGAGGGLAEGLVGLGGLGGGGGGSQGVKSEAARLIAAVVKNSKSKEVSNISLQQPLLHDTRDPDQH